MQKKVVIINVTFSNGKKASGEYELDSTWELFDKSVRKYFYKKLKDISFDSRFYKAPDCILQYRSVVHKIDDVIGIYKSRAYRPTDFTISVKKKP